MKAPLAAEAAAVVTPLTRHMVACEKLTAELAERRRRAQTEPIVVAWKVERRANGQELIRIGSSSSGDDDGGDDDDGDNDESELWEGSAPEEEQDEDGAKADDATRRRKRKRKRKRKRDALVIVDTNSSSNSDDDDDDDGFEQEAPPPPVAAIAPAAADRTRVVYSVDTDDDDDDGSSTDGGACEVVDVREPPTADARSPRGHAFEFAAAAAEGDTTPETNGGSCGDSDVRVKSEAATAAVPRRAIPLMRRKKLDEEDAAFLLFYGISETPTASVLGLIVEYIDRCVGARSVLVSCFLKLTLWRKLNAHVNAALEVERFARSEWMKIMFSSSDASMRQEIYRSPLLPRPVGITVRPLQFVRKRGHGDVGVSAKSDAKHARVRETPKKSNKSSGAAAASATAGQNGRVHSVGRAPSSQESTSMSSPQQPPPASHKRKAASAPRPSLESLAAVQPYSPHKHRRRNGNVSLIDTELPTRWPSGARIPVEVMKPLALNQFMTGTNQSLPLGMRPYDEDAGYRKGPCLPVSPLASMTTKELESHIVSVRNEGRMKSFEKLSEVLGKLMNDAHNYRGAFNSPVDPVALNLPTYTSIVTNPMDLGTVKKKLADGRYIEIEDFARDVRLVFENAKLFNAPGHSVHTSAELLLKRFEAELKNSLERQNKRSSVSKHACNACHGHTCAMCTQQCLAFAQPHLQCSGGCGTDIRKGSIYYLTRDGTRVWCHKCRSRLVRERGGSASSTPTSLSQLSQPSSSSSSSLYAEFSQSQSSQASQPSASSSQEEEVSSAVLDTMVRVKCDSGVEPWVKCSGCARWMHQVCGLFNPVQGEYAVEHDFVCPLCYWRQKASAPPPSSSLHSLLNPAKSGGADESCSSCLDIPPCELSRFIQSFLRQELTAAGEREAAESLNVRVLSFPGEKMTLPEGVVRAFDENANALAHLLPGRDVSAHRLPVAATYLSRGIYLFQKHDGVEVSLFTLYAQEFGDDCELAANRRSVYVAYIDSIRYLKPASARTSAYHLIMLAYFDYIRRHGFDRVHIWSCPPQRRISYVYWCRPAFQKTPNAEHLRAWYSRLLARAQERNIVEGWSTLYDRYLAHEVGGALPVKDENSAAASRHTTRGVTARSVDPGELTWPAAQLPPIFDGDFVPAELERILGRLGARNGKVRSATTEAAAKNATVGSSGGKHALGGGAARVKEEPQDAGAAAPPPPVEFKLREVFDRCQLAVRRMKHDLLVVTLAPLGADTDAPRVACRPERSVPTWCLRVPRFFGNRFMFHQLCSHAGYQFDSLRRAKHSTMMILHHYRNEHVTQANVFCRACSLLVTHAEYWACARCDRFALCDSCFQRDGRDHAHPLRFGAQLNVRVPEAPALQSPPPPP